MPPQQTIDEIARRLLERCALAGYDCGIAAQRAGEPPIIVAGMAGWGQVVFLGAICSLLHRVSLGDVAATLVQCYTARVKASMPWRLFDPKTKRMGAILRDLQGFWMIFACSADYESMRSQITGVAGGLPWSDTLSAFSGPGQIANGMVVHIAEAMEEVDAFVQRATPFRRLRSFWTTVDEAVVRQ